MYYALAGCSNRATDFTRTQLQQSIMISYLTQSGDEHSAHAIIQCVQSFYLQESLITVYLQSISAL